MKIQEDLFLISVQRKINSKTGEMYLRHIDKKYL